MTRYLVRKDAEAPLIVPSLEGLEGWSVEGQTETEDILDAIIELGAIDAEAVEQIAFEQIEEGGKVEFIRKTIILGLWEEAQRFRLAYLVQGAIPTDVTACYMLFPGLTSVAMLTGLALTEVATSIEKRFWKRVRLSHLFHAKILLGRDAVRKAITGEDKIRAAREIDWKDNND